MNRYFNFMLAIAIAYAASTVVYADVLYEADFSTFADGDLEGQDDWNAQTSWQVSSGITQNSGSWARAKQLTGFNMQPNDVVRLTVNFSLTGTPGTGNELARFGFGRDDETPGENTPAVFAGVTWNGTSLSIGGATDNNYDPGDEIEAVLTFTRLPSANSWLATSRCMNLTDGTSFEAGFSPGDSAGTASPETTWEWMDLGNNGQFAMRTFDNSTMASVNVTGFKTENNLPPDTPIAEVIYEADFSTFDTNFLAGQDGWESQADWIVTGGVVNNSGNWQRARQLSPITMAVDDQIRITTDMMFTGTPGPEDFFSMGLAKNNEDTGSNTPQVEGIVNWQGTDLSIGGATDAGYDSGETVTLTLLFTRESMANTWTLETMIDNLDDGTCFSGMTVPTDDPGTVSPETAWEWLETGDTAFFGMRMLNNSGGVTVALSNMLIEKNPSGDDPMVLLGDVTLDGVVNLLDVAPFVSLITNAQFQLEADINMDGVVNLLDVAPFVAILTGG